ncbi:TetR/AcrR family transcriptional regulator [Nocardia aurantia]|uniref:Tetracyclin repressor-like C-terminal domain-containing protein n=1 Tax=Nocardia aurantia TaxID=2585199 RepID=A0A7K0DP30_9NOCA|nr:TetR/AcrR family transcriptional regulator [Nocardia aurantia]MQY27479.1 hypothetical protein [Nocardia aurantia]
MTSAGPPREAGDRRRLRGDRSRRTVTRHAVDVASLDGLGGLSFGRLADELGVSKAGIQTLFRTKEGLQLATVETAGLVFAEEVVRPAHATGPGPVRLHALLDAWIAYIERPLLPGGCFWNANLPEFDSRPGPIRDALTAQRRAWLATLTTELAHAAPTRAPADLDLIVFQLDAAVAATNTALRLGDSSSTGKLRRVIADLVPARR